MPGRRARALFWGMLGGAAVAAVSGGPVTAQEEPGSPVEVLAQLVQDEQLAVSYPLLLGRTEDALYFTALTGEMGREIWRVTSRDAAPELVCDTVPGRGGISVGPYLHELPAERPRALGDCVWYSRNGELFRIDGNGSIGTVTTTDPAMFAIPYAFGRIGDRTLVGAATSSLGNEPHVHVAGDTGTTLLVDIAEGTDSSDPELLGHVGGSVLFSAFDAEHGREIWKSDGTTGGTALLIDLVEGATGSEPTPLLYVDGALLFWARDADGATSLWRTDGTAEGTTLLVDGSGSGLTEIPPSISRGEYDPAFPDAVALPDGDMVFVAGTESAGEELWCTDGTPEGTRQIVDLAGGSPSSAPSLIGTIDGLVYFGASTGGDDRFLWSTDGTAQGTELVANVSAERLFRPDEPVPSSGGALVFAGTEDTYGREPWSTDGTEAGTQPLADLAAGEASPFTRPWIPNSPFYVGMAVTFDGALWLDANGVLSVSDGTPGGTKPVFVAPSDEPGPDAVARLTSRGSRLYAELYPGSATTEPLLFGTDRTTGALEPTIQPYGRTDDSGVNAPTSSFQDSVFVFTHETSPERISRLWRVDDVGLELVKTFTYGTNQSSFPALVHEADGVTYFTAPGDADRSLWCTDGTAAGTVELWAGRPVEFADSGDGTYVLIWHSQYDNRIIRTDGTTEGTSLVSAHTFSGAGTQLAGLTAFDGSVFFSSGEESPRRLWITDGTSAGTQPYEDTPNGVEILSPRSVTPVGDRLWLVGTVDDAYGLHFLDGDGDVTFVEDTAGTLRSPQGIVAFGDSVLFTAEDDDHGRELWISDGTADGTHLVRDIACGPRAPFIEQLTAVGGGRAVFTAATRSHGIELWTTDGTESGTRRVTDILPGPATSNPLHVTLDGDRVVFATSPVGLATTVYGVDVDDLATVPATEACATPFPVELGARYGGPGAVQPPPVELPPIVPPPEPPPPPGPEVLEVGKLRVRMPLRKTDRDKIDLVGRLPVPAEFDATGAEVDVEVGGAPFSFTLRSDGKAEKAEAGRRFRIKLRRKGRANPRAKFTMRISKIDLSNVLSDEDLELPAGEDRVDREILVRVTWQGTEYEATVPVRYTERRARGVARDR